MELGATLAYFALHFIVLSTISASNFPYPETLVESRGALALYASLFAVTVCLYVKLARTSPGYTTDILELPTTFQKGSPDPWCDVCNRPIILRAKHCRHCKKCVLTFDHHCGWIGQCIGQRNARLFYVFVTLQAALTVWTCDMAFAVRERLTASERDTSNIFYIQVMAVMVLTFFFSAFLVGLLCFHTFLACTAQTTHEILRRDRLPYLKDVPDHVILFGGHPCRNFWEFCCDRRKARDTREPLRWALPSREEIERRAAAEDCCSNRYYSCC